MGVVIRFGHRCQAIVSGKFLLPAIPLWLGKPDDQCCDRQKQGTRTEACAAQHHSIHIQFLVFRVYAENRPASVFEVPVAVYCRRYEY